ncbi:hypothetical protein ACJX0J_014454, partial [Zea mays]
MNFFHSIYFTFCIALVHLIGTVRGWMKTGDTPFVLCNITLGHERTRTKQLKIVVAD